MNTLGFKWPVWDLVIIGWVLVVGGVGGFGCGEGELLGRMSVGVFGGSACGVECVADVGGSPVDSRQ